MDRYGTDIDQHSCTHSTSHSITHTTCRLCPSIKLIQLIAQLAFFLTGVFGGAWMNPSKPNVRVYIAVAIPSYQLELKERIKGDFDSPPAIELIIPNPFLPLILSRLASPTP